MIVRIQGGLGGRLASVVDQSRLRLHLMDRQRDLVHVGSR